MGGTALSELGTPEPSVPLAEAERLRFLGEAADILFSSLEHEAMLDALAKLAVPRLADSCVLYVRDDAGSARVAARSHGNAEGGTGRPGTRVAEVLETAEPVIARDQLVLPLSGRRGCIGAVALSTTTSGRVFGEADAALALEFARRAASAVDNAVVLWEADRASARLELQNQVGLALAEAADDRNAAERILELLCGSLDWDFGQLWLFDEGGRTLHVAAAWGRPELDAEPFARASRERTFIAGAGLPGRVWASGEPAWIVDFGADRNFPREPAAAQAGLQSAFAFPLLLVGEVVGVAEFFSRAQRRPEPALDETLASIGSQLGLFLERMRAEREREGLLRGEQAARSAAEEVARTLGKLEEVTEAALRHVASGDVLEELLAQIARLVEADTSAILLLDEERRFLTVRATVGFDRELEHAVPIPYGEGMAGRVAASRKPVVIRDLDDVELASPHLRKRGIKSLVAIPITIGDQVIGVAHAGSVQHSHFDEEDMRLLRLMADRLALAISQAQLYEDERTARRDAELAHRRLSFLAEASTLLASSLDYESTLKAVARLAVPHLADWCVIDVADEEGTLSRIAATHVDPEKVSLVQELQRRWPPKPDSPFGPYAVLRTGTPELLPEVSDDLLQASAQDEVHLARLREIPMRSYMSVPMWGRDRVLGVLSFATGDSERTYTEADLALAEELARRAAVAVENALLFRQAEERARAARVLAAIGDGVFLVDGRGVVGLWNPAAEEITGLTAETVVGRRVEEAIPGWIDVVPRVPVVAEHDRAAVRAETVPLEIGDRELWLSMSGVGFADGTVYAFRDLTQDRVLDELKADFVSTVSHELRTPLAAIYGAAMTLRRRDFAVDEEQRDKLLGVVAQESERLATIVNDILWASRLDAQSMQFSIQSCDAAALARGVIDAADVHRPPQVQLVLSAPEDLPRVAGDPDKIRQVLVNLLDNAIKYSPDGGQVVVELGAAETSMRFSVHDDGLGIPPAEQRRVFEKFYRLDPNLTRGVGGTGLGLYICRELVHRMNGRLWVVSPRDDGKGSTFAFELPLAAHQG
jgi:signal transduction histidine kinase/putative methionine-R-sulfoxide reductase with GAF domain